MRTMYDSVNAVNIPQDAEMVAGYVTGNFTWSNSDWARFPKAVKIRIDVTGASPLASDVLDVEPGNLGVLVAQSQGDVERMWSDLCARAKAWVETRHAHGLGSTCYIEASRKNQLAEALKGLPCVYWMADWGIGLQRATDLVQGAEIAVQYIDEPGFDLSVVHDDWFPATPATPPPPPKPFLVTLVSVEVIATYSDKTTKKYEL